MRLYVGGLRTSVDAADARKLFERVKEVENVSDFQIREGGDPLKQERYAFVTVEPEEAGFKCIKMYDKCKWKQCTLKVERVKQPQFSLDLLKTPKGYIKKSLRKTPGESEAEAEVEIDGNAGVFDETETLRIAKRQGSRAKKFRREESNHVVFSSDDDDDEREFKVDFSEISHKRKIPGGGGAEEETKSKKLRKKIDDAKREINVKSEAQNDKSSDSDLSSDESDMDENMDIVISSSSEDEEEEETSMTKVKAKRNAEIDEGRIEVQKVMDSERRKALQLLSSLIGGVQDEPTSSGVVDMMGSDDEDIEVKEKSVVVEQKEAEESSSSADTDSEGEIAKTAKKPALRKEIQENDSSSSSSSSSSSEEEEEKESMKKVEETKETLSTSSSSSSDDDTESEKGEKPEPEQEKKTSLRKIFEETFANSELRSFSFFNGSEETTQTESTVEPTMMTGTDDRKEEIVAILDESKKVDVDLSVVLKLISKRAKEKWPECPSSKFVQRDDYEEEWLNTKSMMIKNFRNKLKDTKVRGLAK